MNFCACRRMLSCCVLAVMAVTGSAWAEVPAAAGGAPNNAAAKPGHATVTLWSSPRANQLGTYAEEVPWQFAAQETRSFTLPIEGMNQGAGYFAERVRCLLTAPKDGYYLISFEASGIQQSLLSDDATPERVRTLWTECFPWLDYPTGFNQTRLRTEGPWRYFKQGEARYLEIRHIHIMGPTLLQLVWTLPDGTRQKIPATCITNYLPPTNDVTPGNGTQPDGSYGEVLKAVTGTPVKIDLKRAKALSRGWAMYDGMSTTCTSDRIDPKPDVTQPALTCTFGGDIDFPFVTQAAGYAVLSTQLQLCAALCEYVHIVCEREIDGVRFDRETLKAPSSAAPTFRCVTPWLAAGQHTLRLHFTPAYFGGTCRLFALAVQEVPSGAASDALRACLTTRNEFLTARGDGAFLTSPACVEVASRTTATPTLAAGGKELVLQPATSNTWWADVPLPESGADLALVSRSTADATEARATARWAETRVSDHPEVYLRAGDALRVTACTADAGAEQKGAAMIVFQGKDIETPPGKPYICRFTQAGDETVLAREVRANGQPVISRMLVHVLPRTRTVVESEWTRTDRFSLLKEFPAGAWPDGGEAVAFRATPADAGRKASEWKVLPRMAGTWPAVWRAGATGPVLGMLRVRAMEVSGNNRHHYLEDDPDFKSLICDYCFVTGLPPGWKISATLVGPKRMWHFLRGNPSHPAQQLVNPWREGAVAVGQFWLRSDNPKPSAGYDTEYELIPPESPE